MVVNKSELPYSMPDASNSGFFDIFIGWLNTQTGGLYSIILIAFFFAVPFGLQMRRREEPEKAFGYAAFSSWGISLFLLAGGELGRYGIGLTTITLAAAIYINVRGSSR